MSDLYGINKWVSVGVVDDAAVDVIIGNELMNEDNPELNIPKIIKEDARGLVVTRSQARAETRKGEKERVEQEITKVRVNDVFDQGDRNEKVHENINPTPKDGGPFGESGKENVSAAKGLQTRLAGHSLDVGRNDLIRGQQEDESLKTIWEKVVNDEANDEKCYFYTDEGVFMRKWTGRNQSEGYQQIVVPKNYRLKLLEVAHDNLTAGHLGVGKTQQRLMTNFYWPGVFQDVVEYC